MKINGVIDENGVRIRSAVLVEIYCLDLAMHQLDIVRSESGKGEVAAINRLHEMPHLWRKKELRYGRR